MKHFFNRHNIRYIVPVFFSIVLAYYISMNWYQLMLIQGSSMEPTYHNMQIVVLDKHTKDYAVGDVIAFNCEKLSSVLVKRIVALPGDSVQITDGTLYVNGRPTDLYPQGIFDEEGVLIEEIILGVGEYIVIGDNVQESKDSRYKEVGVVEKSTIIGRIL